MFRSLRKCTGLVLSRLPVNTALLPASCVPCRVLSDSSGDGATIGDLVYQQPRQTDWVPVKPDDNLVEVASRMKEFSVGSVMVQVNGDRGGDLQGIITERDFVRRFFGTQGETVAPESLKAKDIMTSADQLLTVTPKHTVWACMELMVDKRVRHMPVMEEGSQQLLGVVSIRDALRQMVNDHRKEVENLQNFVTGGYSS